jgi:hypothetical protein
LDEREGINVKVTKLLHVEKPELLAMSCNTFSPTPSLTLAPGIGGMAGIDGAVNGLGNVEILALLRAVLLVLVVTGTLIVVVDDR